MLGNMILRIRRTMGFTLFEIVLSVAVLGVGTLILADAFSSQAGFQKTRVAAEHMRIFSSAMRQYMSANATELMARADENTPILIKPETLSDTGFLPDDFDGRNVYGHQVCGLILKSHSGSLNALAVSEGGNSLDDTELASIVALVGGEGGGIYVDSPGIVRGSGGAWQFASDVFSAANDQGQDCSGNAGNVLISGGHFVQALWLNDYIHANKLLSRIADPEDLDANRMETDLDMNGHSIINVSNINASGRVSAGNVVTGSDLAINEHLQLDGIAVEGSGCSPNGLIARSSNGSLLSCQNGVWVGLGSPPSTMIGYFPSSGCPDGWKAADGTNGTVDLRGVFIRGWDHGRGLDVGRARNSMQGDAIRNITGTFGVAQGGQYSGHTSSGVLYGTTSGYSGAGKLKRTDGDPILFDASRVVPTADEFRPKNIALMVCQKE